MDSGPAPAQRGSKMRLRETGDKVPVALYIRSIPGDPADSLNIQLQALQSHAARNGMEQVRVFFDAQGAGHSSRK